MSQAWKFQNVLKDDINFPTPNDIIVKARNIKSLKTRALFIILYLTGGRISEVVKSIAKCDVSEPTIDGKKIMIIRMRNRKNKRTLFKNQVIVYEMEKELVDMLKEFIDPKDIEDIFFNYSYVRAWKVLKKYVGYNPHWIRHIRLTHLVTYFDFNDRELVTFAGWSNSDPAREYVKMRISDLVHAFCKTDKPTS
jgi:integrase